MTGSMGAWLGRSGLAAALLVFPFSDLVLPAACGAGQGCWPPVTAAALAAVSAAAIIALASAGFLGRHVYDELLQDILDRTRANGWESVAALVPQAPLPPPVLLVDEADRRLDAAVQEARASAEAEVARITSEADERLAAAVHEARAAGAAKLADVQREAERLLAARVAQERAEAVPKAQASAPARKQTLEEHLEEARAQVARYRKSAV